jgi:cell division protein FtsW
MPGLGASFGKARSWVIIFGFSFQPSEIVKLTFLLFLAGWCYKKGRDRISDFGYGLVPFIFFLMLILGLVIAQPDIGTTIIIGVMAVLVYFLAGAKLSHLGWLGLAGVAGFSILALKKTYLVNRLLVFLNPESDVQGIGYHINQALLAIGSGGWFGRGYGKSQQKFAYLPEVHGDSIFAIIAEEMGFIVVLFLVGLFLFLMYRGFKVAQNSSDEYGKLLASGIVVWFTFQAFLNIAVISGLAPLTGIPLPFISAGGTALTISLAAVGLLLNISKQ